MDPKSDEDVVSLPSEAVKALKSFDETCLALGGPAHMNLLSFTKLIHSIQFRGSGEDHGDGNYNGSQIETLFCHLHNQICASILDAGDDPLEGITHTKEGEKIVTRTGLAALYASEAYAGLNRPGCRRNAVSAMFEEIDLSLNGRRDRLQRTLSAAAGNIPSRYDIDQTGLPKNVVDLTDPRSASVDEFITALEAWTLNHPAIHHTFYRGISNGAFGNAQKSRALLFRFLEGYRLFSRNFTSYVSSLLDFYGGDDELLSENLAEENGIYDDDILQTLREQGFDANKIVGIPHKDLQARIFQKMECMPGMKDQLREIPDVSRLGLVLQDTVKYHATKSLVSSLGSLYFGCELIVPSFYRKILDAIETLFGKYLSRDDTLFYHLHIDIDKDHATKLKEKVFACVSSNDSISCRMELLFSAVAIMDERHRFVCEAVAELTSTQGPVQATNKLYNKQSSNWKRTEKKCLSDFTGRPHIFEMCEGLGLRDKWVLDVGCGEGFPARTLTGLGASKVIGVDVSEKMVDLANSIAVEEEICHKQRFFAGSATKLRDVLEDNYSEIPILPGLAGLKEPFDVAVAIFLFNYLSTQDTAKCMEQVHSLLRPGGHFIFSVPHPMMAFLHQSSNASSDPAQNETPTFSFERISCGGSKQHYFSLRDMELKGVIKTIEGVPLNVRMRFKTLHDYFELLMQIGFQIIEVREASVTEEHMKLNPKFFKSVEDQPLHLIFKVQKPVVQEIKGSYLESPSMWTNLQRRNLESLIDLPMPEAVLHELVGVAENQICAIDYSCFGSTMTCDELLHGLNVSKLPLSRRFAMEVRDRISAYGACCVKNGTFCNSWETEHFANTEKESKLASCPGYDGTDIAKICYLILSSLIGTIDDSARGALFDVQYKVSTSKGINVLVSNTNDDSGWHTDGASFDRRYGIVGLQCIKPTSTSGGEFMISHSGNALHDMETKLPQFLLYELQRPVLHDVLENGKGLGRSSFTAGQRVGNDPRVIAQRIKINSYPIYDHCNSSGILPFAFRYMRAWITRAYDRAEMPLSPLLKIAMDCLDQALDRNTAFKRCLKASEICYVNNLLIAHRRTAFGNDQERHMVRIWLKEE
mmetsp:Transcript_13358/g.20291  ORF Transcript_13358/g.20291 Transcript_13358/m.20291 type:complete len:1097 (+) Transcript_13358:24-3314(+)